MSQMSDLKRTSYRNRLMELGLSYDDAYDIVEDIITDTIAEMSQSSQAFYIKVNYRTGDSFGSYDASEDIDLPWHNITIVEENKRRLEEQVELYNKLEHFWDASTQRDAINKWINADWNVKPSLHSITETYTVDDKEIKLCLYSIKLLKDDGTEFIMSTSWLGYFESSQYFSIELVNEHKS